MLKKSLRTKLIIWLIVIATVPLGIGIILSGLMTNEGFNQIISEDIEKSLGPVNNNFGSVASELLGIGEIHAQNKELIAALQNKDRQKMSILVQPIFERLNKENDIKVFEIEDEKGIVFFRGHAPEKYGDDKSDVPSIQASLAGESNAGFEFGSSGLAVRAFVPVKTNGKIIGVLQLGLDESFLTKVQHSLTLDVTLYDSNSILITATGETDKAQIGSTLEDPSIFEKVKEGENVSKKATIDSKSMFDSFSPLYDPTQTEVVGMIKIEKDQSAVKQIQQHILYMNLVIILATIIVVVIISLFIARAITNPILKLREFMGEVSQGNLAAEWQGKHGQDEIGHLSKGSVDMAQNLRTLISQVMLTSEQVAASSEQLSASSEQSSKATEKIADSIIKIATGSQEQLNYTVDSKETVTELASGMEQISKSVVSVTDLSNESYRKAEDGNQMISRTVSQMHVIHEKSKATAEVVNILGEKSTEIGSIISLITEIANQTNLLALNAAIEAARAGESGRGFAVVADEVRNLAEKSADATRKISAIINEIQTGTSQAMESMKEGNVAVDEGMQLASQAGISFKEIVEAVNQTSSEVQEVSASVQQITAGIHELVGSIEKVTRISEESASYSQNVVASAEEQNASMEEIAATSRVLAQMAEGLQNSVQVFKL